MQRTTVALLASLVLIGTAAAAEQGASSKSPGHEMQDRGSAKGSPGASGYAQGHEMRKSDSTGSTGRMESGRSGTSGGPGPDRR